MDKEKPVQLSIVIDRFNDPRKMIFLSNKGTVWNVSQIGTQAHELGLNQAKATNPDLYRTSDAAPWSLEVSSQEERILIRKGTPVT